MPRQGDFVAIVIGSLWWILRDSPMSRDHGQCVFVLREVGGDCRIAADGEFVPRQGRRPICERPASLGSHTQCDFITIVIGGLLRSLRDSAMRRNNRQGVLILREVGDDGRVPVDGHRAGVIGVFDATAPIGERPTRVRCRCQGDHVTVMVGRFIEIFRHRAMQTRDIQGVFVLREIGGNGGVALHGQFVTSAFRHPAAKGPAGFDRLQDECDFVPVMIGGLVRALCDRRMSRNNRQGIFILSKVSCNRGVTVDRHFVPSELWRPAGKGPAGLSQPWKG